MRNVERLKIMLEAFEDFRKDLDPVNDPSCVNRFCNLTVCLLQEVRQAIAVDDRGGAEVKGKTSEEKIPA